ncbi:MAG: MarC family protein [Spongiibacteraceae bacterium]|jgi:MarC family membrane protein|nr:MarC family protein [Spongiibacteraceae bacterium]
MDESVLSAAFLLFLILDPFGNIPLAAALLRTVPPQRRPRVVLRECLIAYIVLLLFLLFGAPLMAFLELSQTSVGIAGGVVLLLIALKMIFPSGAGLFGDEGGGEPLIVPLAIPAIAGPSSMAMVMLLASREPERLWAWMGALTLATAASTVVLVSGGKLISLMGERGTKALERLAGLILTTIAVEMLLRGIRDFVATL